MANKKKDIIFKETEQVYYLLITSETNHFLGIFYDACETGTFKVNHKGGGYYGIGRIPSKSGSFHSVWKSRTKADLVTDSDNVTSLIMKESSEYPGCAIINRNDYYYKLLLISKDYSNFQSIIDKHEEIKNSIAREEKKKRLDLLNLEVGPGIVYKNKNGTNMFYKIDSIDEEKGLLSKWIIYFRNGCSKFSVEYTSESIEEFKTLIAGSTNDKDLLLEIINSDRFVDNERELVNFIINQ